MRAALPMLADISYYAYKPSELPDAEDNCR